MKAFLNNFKEKFFSIGHSPSVDWVWIFTLGCIGALVYGTWGIMLYDRIQSGKGFDASTVSAEHKEQLNVKALTEISERLGAGQEGKSVTNITIADPSR